MAIDEDTLDIEDVAYVMELGNELRVNDTDENSRRTGQRKRKAEKGQANKKLKKLTPIRLKEQQAPNQTFDVRGSPTASQPTVSTGTEKPVRVLINENKSPPEVKKILMDRLNRRITIDESADQKNFILLLDLVNKFDVSYLSQTIAKALNRISSKWPVRSDLDKIRKALAKERGMRKGSTFDEEMILRFEAIEKALKAYDKKRVEDSLKVGELADIFCNEKITTEALREKLSTAFPYLFEEEDATGKLPENKISEQISTTKAIDKKALGEKLSAAFPLLCLQYNETLEDLANPDKKQLDMEEDIWKAVDATNELASAASLQKGMEALKNELFDENNRNMKVSDYAGLKERIDSADDRFPADLKTIIEKIKLSRDEPTPDDDLHGQLLVILAAAIEEMQDLAAEKLSKTKLRKWAAAFNMAKFMRFQAPYFQYTLEKHMRVYLHCFGTNTGLEN